MIIYNPLWRVNNLELKSNYFKYSGKHMLYNPRKFGTRIKSGNENGQHLHYPYPVLDRR